MLEILPANLEELEQICEENSLKKNDNTSAIVAKDKLVKIGYCLFDIVNNAIYIKAINPVNDALLADGLLRSALFYSTEHGCTDAFYTHLVSEEFLEKIGFIANKETKELKLLKIFDSCDCCKK